MPQEFRLRVERTAADYHAFVRQSARERNNASGYRIFSFGVGIVAMLAVLILMHAAFGAEPMNAARLALALLAAFGVWFLALWITAPLFRDRLNQPPSLFLGAVELSADADGIALANDGFSQRFVWSLVSDVVETAAYVFLRIGGRSSIVIPKRAFDPPPRAAEFVAAVRENVALASSKP